MELLDRTLAKIQPADGGAYVVVVTNYFSAATALPAALVLRAVMLYQQVKRRQVEIERQPPFVPAVVERLLIDVLQAVGLEYSMDGCDGKPLRVLDHVRGGAPYQSLCGRSVIGAR